jgi:glycosyltransferase involved in cell wall biosynthesis
MAYVSLIIPLYNEQPMISPLFHALNQLLKHSDQKHSYQILVVDDGSTDGSDTTLQSMEPLPNTDILSHTVNKGRGAAIKTALQKAEGDLVIHVDADLEYDLMDIPAIVDAFGDSLTSVVFGSRMLPSFPTPMFLSQRMANYWLSFIANRLYHLGITDLMTGYKALRTDLYKSFTIHSNRFDYEAELLAQLSIHKTPIKEVPVGFHPRSKKKGKKIKASDFFKVLRILWKHRPR